MTDISPVDNPPKADEKHIGREITFGHEKRVNTQVLSSKTIPRQNALGPSLRLVDQPLPCISGWMI
jgi:hypothetical protein